MHLKSLPGFRQRQYKSPKRKSRHLPEPLGSFENFLAETYTEKVTVEKDRTSGAQFGKDFNADAIWCVVQGQTMIRLANRVKELMNVPLLTEVWDPPTWWLRAKQCG